MSAGSSSRHVSKLCELCDINPSKYCCPRCEVLYCSLDCYKSHNHVSCSESFYHDWVTEELSTHHTDDESKQKMIDILKKMREEGSLGDLEPAEDIDETDSDDSEDLNLQDRIKNLDLEDADAVWNALTSDERNEFEALLNQGDVGSILPQWDPWWTYSKDARLVQDVDSKEEEEALKKCPVMIRVPKFRELMAVQPSPVIRYNITNVLASYAFVMRYFNGEVDPVEGTLYLLDICANLDSNTNFEEAATAVESVTQKCLQSQLIETDKASLEVMRRDTFSLLQGPSEEHKLYYCRAALSQLRTFLYQAKNTVKPKVDDKPTQLPKLDGKPTKLPILDEKPTKLPILDEKPTKLPILDEKPTKLPYCNQKTTTLVDPDEQNAKVTFSKKFPDQKGDYLPKLDVSQLKKCIKKVEFYLSFVESCGMDFE